MRNFVDFTEVDPYVGPMKKEWETVESIGEFNLDHQMGRGYSFIEHRFSLEDSLF